MANLYRLNSFLIIETQKSLYKFTIENIILFKFTLPKRCYSTISFTVVGCVQEPAGQANTSPRLPEEGGTWGNVDGLSEKPEAPELDGGFWAYTEPVQSPDDKLGLSNHWIWSLSLHPDPEPTLSKRSWTDI